MIPYLNRRVRPGVEVMVYRNLRRGGGVWYSVVQSGRVVAHCREVCLVDARFVVRTAGRDRARRTGVKNVHAFVVGIPVLGRRVARGAGMPVAYNPMTMDGFCIRDTQLILSGAERVLLGSAKGSPWLEATGVVFDSRSVTVVLHDRTREVVVPGRSATLRPRRARHAARTRSPA